MFEPNLTGISYSFTNDGYYEEAYYRAISNRTFDCRSTPPFLLNWYLAAQPQCPKGIMQFQHGTFSIAANGSLTLDPFGVDGRQLLSDPCNYKNSIYTRYNQTEVFEVSLSDDPELSYDLFGCSADGLLGWQRYSVYTDAYHNVPRLDLYRFDGSPMNPMYLAYSPPQMLPTQTLNPTASSSTGGAKTTGNAKAKRSFADLEGFAEPMNRKAMMKRNEPTSAERWWWIGVGMTAIGGVGYFCF